MFFLHGIYSIYDDFPIKCKELTHLWLASQANSVDLDQTPNNAASGQGLRCLYSVQEFL